MTVKRAFRFSYYGELHSNDLRLPHKQRDGDAFIELMELLRVRGYAYGDLILNPPGRDPTGCPSVPTGWSGAPSELGPDDLIVLTTRPPLSDECTKRKIARSYTALEIRVLDALAHLFDRCTVDHIVLRRRLVGSLKDDELRHRSEAVFWTNHSTKNQRHARSAYREYREAHCGAHFLEVDGGAKPQTMAYLLLIETNAWLGGPGLLCSFSTGGTQTLVWNHWLRRRHGLRPLILDPGSRFVIANITMDPLPSGDWVDLSPADAWDLQYEAVPLVLDHEGLWIPDAASDHVLGRTQGEYHPA